MIDIRGLDEGSSGRWYGPMGGCADWESVVHLELGYTASSCIQLDCVFGGLQARGRCLGSGWVRARQKVDDGRG